MMDKHDKILVLGGTGLVGSSLIRELHKRNYTNILSPTRSELDLINTKAVLNYFQKVKPDYIFLCAAKVGGIFANNTYPADFIYDNIMIQTNVIEAARKVDVKKLLLFGSSCIYPKYAKQPIKENELLSGYLEPTNKPYAISKIAGIVMAEAYHRQYNMNIICAMPTNLYGPNDNFDLDTSHVLPALIRKFYEAKIHCTDAILWGDGEVYREFLYVDDLADAAIFLMNNYNDCDPINIGCGRDIKIKHLASLVQSIVGHTGQIIWDKSKPSGTPRKLLDITKITKMGWTYKIKLKQGIIQTYEWFVNNKHKYNL